MFFLLINNNTKEERFFLITKEREREKYIYIFWLLNNISYFLFLLPSFSNNKHLFFISSESSRREEIFLNWGHSWIKVWIAFSVKVREFKITSCKFFEFLASAMTESSLMESILSSISILVKFLHFAARAVTPTFVTFPHIPWRTTSLKSKQWLETSTIVESVTSSKVTSKKRRLGLLTMTDETWLS